MEGQRMRLLQLIGIFVIASMFTAPAAYAYLDPGTASIILQGLIGGAVAAGAAVSIFWTRVKSVFRRKKPEPPKIASDE